MSGKLRAILCGQKEATGESGPVDCRVRGSRLDFPKGMATTETGVGGEGVRREQK